MLFSSLIFIFAFLPGVLFGYFLLPNRYRNYFLLIASLVFYAWGEPKYVLAMIFSILINYMIGMLIGKFRNKARLTKCLLISAVFINLGMLFIFKYLNFTISNFNIWFDIGLPQTDIILPIGISFFTFQALSYVIDVYRNNVSVQKNPFFVGMYISFFPQLIAGPIVRYITIEQQINKRTITLDSFSTGIKRFITGLSKKVLLANTLAIIADEAFSQSSQLSVSFAWLGAIAYTFQIFFDFSGYSDMAIGLGVMFGFRFSENFNYPYISKSISEFWRRWHISLGSWFRDYVYFPLGGSRVKKKSRLVFNLFVVWSLTGIWHGASWNFVIWGLLYFILIAFEKLTGIPKRLNSKFLRTCYQVFTLLCVIGGWVIFRADGLKNAVRYGLGMFGLRNNALFDNVTLLYLKENWLFLLFAVLCTVPIFSFLKSKTDEKTLLRKTVNFFSVFVYMFLLLLAVSYLVLGENNPFIYFNF